MKLARQHLRDCSDFFVMNGDSFLEIDLSWPIRFIVETTEWLLWPCCKWRMLGATGRSCLDKADRVNGFAEKTASDRPGLVNGGV